MHPSSSGNCSNSRSIKSHRYTLPPTAVRICAWVLFPKASYNRRIRPSPSSAFFTELPAEKWVAKWIKPAKHYEGWAPYLRKKFTTGKAIKRAMLYASGLGCAEYYINGKRICEDCLKKIKESF